MCPCVTVICICVLFVGRGDGAGVLQNASTLIDTMPPDKSFSDAVTSPSLADTTVTTSPLSSADGHGSFTPVAMSVDEHKHWLTGVSMSGHRPPPPAGVDTDGGGGQRRRDTRDDAGSPAVNHLAFKDRLLSAQREELNALHCRVRELEQQLAARTLGTATGVLYRGGAHSLTHSHVPHRCLITSFVLCYVVLPSMQATVVTS